MRVDDGDFVEVAIKGERAGIAQMQIRQTLEPKSAHELSDFLRRDRPSRHVGLGRDDNQAARFAGDAFQADFIAENAILQEQAVQILERSCGDEFWFALREGEDGETKASRVSGFEIKLA